MNTKMQEMETKIINLYLDKQITKLEKEVQLSCARLLLKRSPHAATVSENRFYKDIKCFSKIFCTFLNDKLTEDVLETILFDNSLDGLVDVLIDHLGKQICPDNDTKETYC